MNLQKLYMRNNVPYMQQQFLQESPHLNHGVLHYMDGKFEGAF